MGKPPRAEPAGPDTAEGEGESGPAIVLETWLPYRMFGVATRIAEILQSYYAPRYGLTLAAWRAMAVVGARPGASAGEIAQAAGLDQFAASRAIGLLVELGLAARESARRDRRFAAIALTPEGRRVFLDVSRLALRLEAELVAGLDPAERAALEGALAKVEDASAVLRAKGLRGVMPEG